MAQIDKKAHDDPNRNRNGIGGCSVIGGDCDPGDYEQCSEAYEPGWMSMRSFWVFKAVKGVHRTISMLENELVGSTLAESLRLKSIVDDFDVSDKDDASSALLGLLSGALSMVATGAGAVGKADASTGMGIMSGLLGQVSSAVAGKDTEAIPLGEVQKALGDGFESWRAGLREILKVSMGNVTSEDDYDELPDFSGGDITIDDPLLKFYSTPFWLLDDDANAVGTVVDEIGKNIKRKLVDIILNTGNYQIVAETSKTEDNCSSEWIKAGDGHYCFYVQNRMGDSESKLTTKMKDHGIENLREFMTIAIDCASTGDSGTSKIDAKDTINIDGKKKPRCFYSLPVKKTEVNEDAHQGGIVGCTSKCNKLVDFFS